MQSVTYALGKQACVAEVGERANYTELLLNFNSILQKKIQHKPGIPFHLPPTSHRSGERRKLQECKTKDRTVSSGRGLRARGDLLPGAMREQ